MRIYKGVSASPGLVVGQVSRLERHVETFENGPFNPDREHGRYYGGEAGNRSGF